MEQVVEATTRTGQVERTRQNISLDLYILGHMRVFGMPAEQRLSTVPSGVFAEHVPSGELVDWLKSGVQVKKLTPG